MSLTGGIRAQSLLGSKMLNMNLEMARKKRMLQPNEIEEFRQYSYESLRIYEEKTKALHDTHLVKNEFKSRQ